jgi:hypothetical protein
MPTIDKSPHAELVGRGSYRARGGVSSLATNTCIMVPVKDHPPLFLMSGGVMPVVGPCFFLIFTRAKHGF